MGGEGAAGSAWRYDEPEILSEWTGGIEADSLDDAQPHVLPLFPRQLLAGTLHRLTAHERALALKYKIVAVDTLSDLTLQACVTLASEREAERRGLKLVARILPGDFRDAVHEVFAEELLKQAVFHLAAARPDFSARLRFWPGQAAVVLALAVSIGLWAFKTDPGQVYLGLSIFAGLFFAMTVALRVFALTPVMAPGKPPVLPITTGDLPTYTVLVPLFRETAVLHQLIGGLMAINYPALCIKRTKTG